MKRDICYSCTLCMVHRNVSGTLFTYLIFRHFVEKFETQAKISTGILPDHIDDIAKYF